MASASALLGELEDLRKVLDSKSPARSQGNFTPTFSASAPPQAIKIESVRAPLEASSNLYSAALSDAEANVDRLGRAMEAAEIELENTFKRTTELHKNTAERREIEVQELRKILAAKERSIDSLRETLTTTKRNLESRAMQAESTLVTRDSEVKRLKEELAAARGAKKSLESQIEQEIINNRKQLENMGRSETAMREREQELELSGRRLQTEFNNMKAAYVSEKTKKDALQEEIAVLKRELAVTQEKLKAETEVRKEVHKKLEAERKKRKSLAKERSASANSLEAKLAIAELEKRLRSEQRSRLGAEKWLQAELKSKEEMEHLFVAMRDIALKKNDPKADEMASLKQAVQELQSGGASLKEQQAKALLKEEQRNFETSRASIERDNQRLREDLEATRREIANRINPYPQIERELGGDLLARCRRCHERFNLSKPSENACGYHPGELTPDGFTCCGVTPRPGTHPVYCHWRPHVA